MNNQICGGFFYTNSFVVKAPLIGESKENRKEWMNYCKSSRTEGKRGHN